MSVAAAQPQGALRLEPPAAAMATAGRRGRYPCAIGGNVTSFQGRERGGAVRSDPTVGAAVICFNTYIICRPIRKPDIKPARTSPNLAPIQTGASSMTAILMVHPRGGAISSNPGAPKGT